MRDGDMGINECSSGEEAGQQDEQPGLFAFLPTDRYISPFLIRHGNAVPPSPRGKASLRVSAGNRGVTKATNCKFAVLPDFYPAF